MEELVGGEGWAGRKVFITGHTGFKGSWLTLSLAQMGAEVYGYALAPEGDRNLYTEARVHEHVCKDHRGDVRDLASLESAVSSSGAEIIFHLAAQPLVRRSYAEPVETYATNVMGTVHVLEAARRSSSVRAVVLITTDKCYENREWLWGYREDDRLGGFDPYSNSKACAELVAAAYRNSFFAPEKFAEHGTLIATVRAGNVIGGGDWAEDRLIPDLVRAFLAGRSAHIRNPHATRPWQHVLEPLHGYLLLGQRLLAGDAGCATAWNFGPADDDARPVEWIVEHMAARWSAATGAEPAWHRDHGTHPHEANYLKLDCSRAHARLGWQPALPLPRALDWIVEWSLAVRDGADAQRTTFDQIAAYTEQLAPTPKGHRA